LSKYIIHLTQGMMRVGSPCIVMNLIMLTVFISQVSYVVD